MNKIRLPGTSSLIFFWICLSFAGSLIFFALVASSR
jgi:hypothetical protein